VLLDRLERGLRFEHLVPSSSGAAMWPTIGEGAVTMPRPSASPSTMRSCPRAKRFTARPQHCARPW
jgi:hypothetical protein